MRPLLGRDGALLPALRGVRPAFGGAKEVGTMERTDSVSARRIASRVAAVIGAGLLLAGSPAWATSAHFDEVLGFGFEASGLGVPDRTIDGEVDFFGATDVLELTTHICFLVPSDGATCQPNFSQGQTGDFSILQSLTIDAAIDPEFSSGSFTLLLTDLGAVPAYSKGDVSIDLNPTAIAGLDTDAVPGFSLDGTSASGFDPFVVVRDETFSPGTIYHYVGWNVMVGETVTFKVDVAADPIFGSQGGNPMLLANLIPNVSPIVTPEPRTALLMGLGLAGLALSARRS